MLVVLAQRLHDFPLGIEAGREHHQIARNDANGFAALGGDQDFAFQHVCSFLDAEVERELGNFLFPDVPAGNTQFLQTLFARIVFDGDLAPVTS